MIKYGFFLLILLVAACKMDDHKKLALIMTSNCYWDVHDGYSAANQKVAYCYKFNKDGSCLHFFTPDKKGKRDEYNSGDVVVPKTWELQGDTVLYLQGAKRRVLS